MRTRSISKMLKRRRTSWLVLISGLIVFAANGCNQANESTLQQGHDQNMESQIPASIVKEHKELNGQLESAVNSGGRTGEAARIVAQQLHLHFQKEEEYALPPLGLLAPLAQGKISEDMRGTIALSDKLRAELPQMLNEHKGIVLVLDELGNAARDENKLSVVEFTERLRLHARNEEEVMYPAAILVGEILKQRLTPDSTGQ
jgi:hypothetical protein